MVVFLVVAVKWTESAAKHGVTQVEALFAMTHYQYRMLEFDDSRIEGGIRPDLYIGPSRLGGPLLEVMVYRAAPRDLVIFHAMEAREKFLKLMEEE